jgi:hypothetical protein
MPEMFDILVLDQGFFLIMSDLKGLQENSDEQIEKDKRYKHVK